MDIGDEGYTIEFCCSDMSYFYGKVCAYLDNSCSQWPLNFGFKLATGEFKEFSYKFCPFCGDRIMNQAFRHEQASIEQAKEHERKHGDGQSNTIR